MDIIPPVANNATQISSAEFVKVTVYEDYSNVANTVDLTFSSAYSNETIDGTTYWALGGLLSVGAQTRNLRVTSGDTAIAIAGVSGNNISDILATEGKIRGSLVEVRRGFFHANGVLDQSNVYTRFTGVVTNYNIQEDREGKNDTFTITLLASSYKTVLENRIAGRKTNKESWRYFNSNDNSMDNVYAIAGVTFDFGKQTKTSASTGGQVGGCPAPDMRILLHDYTTIAAGELKPGMRVKTHHEDTMIVGDYPVIGVNIETHPRVQIIFDDMNFVCSDTHKFYHDHGWLEAKDVKPGMCIGTKTVKSIQTLPPGEVVRITVDEAHTYVVEGLLSHNKQLIRDPGDEPLP